jgi:hypothetical protein
MNNKEINKNKQLGEEGEARREFLRKSAYAAYATPVVWSLLVEKANAAQSFNPGSNPGTTYTTPPDRYTPGGQPNPAWRPGSGLFTKR